MRQVINYATIQTSAGDSFDTLALAYCGSEMCADEIIALNPDYCDVLIFGEGVQLLVPVYDSTETPETLPPWRREE